MTEAQRREDDERYRNSRPAPRLAPPGGRSRFLLGGKDDRGRSAGDSDQVPASVAVSLQLAERERPRAELPDRLPRQHLDQGRLATLTNRTQTEFGTATQAQSWSDVRGLGRAGFMYAW